MKLLVLPLLILAVVMCRSDACAGICAGICGLAVGPTTADGAFILSADGHLQDPQHTVYRPLMLPMIRLVQWLQDDWQMLLLVLSGVMMAISLALFIYGMYLDRISYLRARVRAAAEGYSTIA